MRLISLANLATAAALALLGSAAAAGEYHELSYSPSTRPGKLQLGVTYTLWIPDNVAKVRGIIVHQHGCGVGACQGGATAAYDLHWQALARKWDCALLGPSYQQEEKQNCRLWCDPRNGSGETFMRALGQFAEKTGHPELEIVPWCLWGHSGGAFWASLMQISHPERILAIWLRSGTALPAWERGEIPRAKPPRAAYSIPVMCNPGQKEKEHERFKRAWTGLLTMFKEYRAKGAPIGFAPDPRTAHECGDSRYLAIAFFHACLEMRLPEVDSTVQKLKPVDESDAWLATVLTDRVEPAAAYSGTVSEAVWLPNRKVAQAWGEYVKTGAVSDRTAGPAPFDVKASSEPGQAIEITWNAQADFESGIRAFIIRRNGADVGQVPQKPVGRFGRPLFQRMSYHDTPEKPLPEMRFTDTSAAPGTRYVYRVIAVNGVEMKSEPSMPAVSP